MTDLLVCAALGIEARALKTDGLRVERVGMGVRHAEEFAARGPAFDALVVAGFGAATDGWLRPGDIVVADEVRQGDAVIECPWADSMAFVLERHLILEPEVDEAPEPHTRQGLNAAGKGTPAVLTGPVATVEHVADAQTLTRLAGEGVTTVDMESFPLVATARGRPFAVVRVVVDTPDHPLVRPSTLRAGLIARKRLRAVGAVLRDWASVLEHV